MEPPKDNPCEKITGDDPVYLNLLYKNDFPKVRWHVIQNSGTEEEASDIFQDSMMVLYQNCREGKLNLSSTVSTYLIGIARNKWLAVLKKKGKASRLNEDEKSYQVDDNIPFDDDTKNQRHRLFAKHFARLSESCQKCLQLYFEGIKGEDISKQLGYNSYEYYRVAKNRCIGSLKKMIREDDLFDEIMS